MTVVRKLSFEIETDPGTDPPSSRELAEAVSQALPDEFWADYREDSWGVVSIFASNHDGTPVTYQSPMKIDWKGMWREQVEANRQMTKKHAELSSQFEQQKRLVEERTVRIARLEETISELAMKLVSKEVGEKWD